MSLPSQIYAILAASSDLAGFVSTRITPTVPTVDTPVLPFLVYTCGSTEPQNTLDGSGSLCKSNLDFTIAALNLADVLGIAQIIQTLIAGYRGGDIQGIFAQDAGSTEQTETGYIGTMSYTVWHRQGANITPLFQQTARITTGIDEITMYADGQSASITVTPSQVKICGSLVDCDGNPFPITGEQGPEGQSAYEIAVANGFEGNETAWLASLVGQTGPAGESIKGDPGQDAPFPSQSGQNLKFLTTDGTTPSFSSVSLTDSVSGVLPPANGGTGTISQAEAFYEGCNAFAVGVSASPGQSLMLNPDGLTVFGNPSVDAGNITSILPVEHGGTGTDTAASAFQGLADGHANAQPADPNMLLYAASTEGGVTSQWGNPPLSSASITLNTDTAIKTRSSTWALSSDRRVKKTIKRYRKSLADVEQIRCVSYQYNGKGGTVAGSVGIGVIAQELESVFPECVDVVPGKLNPRDTEDTDLRQFSAHALLFALINSVQELSKQNKQMRKDLDRVKAGLKSR